MPEDDQPRREATRQRGRRQQQGPLAGHFKQGRVYRPAMLAWPQFEMADWIRDDLPDMLWPAALIALDGDRGGVAFGRLQATVHLAAAKAGLVGTHLVLDGRCTSLEAVPSASREALLPILEREISNAGLMPSKLLAALRLYPDLPGRWLLVDGFNYRERTETDAEALHFLAGVLAALSLDGHKEALLKFAPIAWAIFEGQFQADTTMTDAISSYPSDPARWPLADSIIRASFGASLARQDIQEPGKRDSRAAWAAAFWRRNWTLAPCLPAEDADDTTSPGEPTQQLEDEPVTLVEKLSSEDGSHSDLTELSAQLVGDAVSQLHRYLDGAFSPDLAVNLLEPARHEVISALVVRNCRVVIGVLRAPHQWSSEHASGLLRLLAESEIVLVWLHAQGDSAYKSYQDYGRGKAKLMRRQMADLAKDFGGQPPSVLVEALAHLEGKLGGEAGEEFIEVNLDSNFSGMSARNMAAEVGLEDLYRHAYQSASAVSHSEWHTLEDAVMQRCLNPLHRFHLIPSMSPIPPSRDVAEYCIRSLVRLVDLALSQLQRTPKEDLPSAADRDRG